MTQIRKSLGYGEKSIKYVNFSLGLVKNILLILLLGLTTSYAQAQVACAPCNNDYDGDGIIGCYDRCADTPKGVAVDMHGCPKDTDGDGVADYKDYQLITPTACQPVDSYGVGKCPCPCITGRPTICSVYEIAWVGFSVLSFRLDATAKTMLKKFAGRMKSNPNQNFRIVGFGNSTYSAQQAAWSRVNEIRNYFMEEGIDLNRMIVQYGASGQDYLVKIETTNVYKGEEVGRLLPPPYPGMVIKKDKRVRANWR